MFIVHGGLPRSGTVLVGTIIRALLFRRGIGFTRCNPQERRHLPRYAEIIKARPSQPPTLSHLHLIDRSCIEALQGRADATVFWNYREPRDVLVSLMALHALDFDHALNSTEVYLRSEREMANAKIGLRIKYEDLVAETVNFVLKIAATLEMPIDEGSAVEITLETGPDRHRQIMLALREGQVSGQRENQTHHRTLLEDPDTLINDRHLQSGEQNRWRAELSKAQQDRATAHLRPWIEILGYTL